MTWKVKWNEKNEEKRSHEKLNFKKYSSLVSKLTVRVYTYQSYFKFFDSSSTNSQNISV